MSNSLPEVDTDRWARFHRLLGESMALTDLDEILDRLATGWCQLAGAKVALVWVADSHGESMLVGSLARNGRDATPFCCAQGEKTSFSQVEELHEIWRKLTGKPPEPDASFVTFGEPEAARGGAILVGNAVSVASDEMSKALAIFSEQLIVRALAAKLSKNDQITTTDIEDQKTEALAEFAAGAGHEINNPLATIVGRVQMLLKDETDPERREALHTIGGQAYRIRDMIGDLMLFARPPKPELQALDLTELVRHVEQKLSARTETPVCRFDNQLAETVPICADRSQLCVVISNLLQNSIDAVGEGGAVTVETSSVPVSGVEWALLRISDSGPGLSVIDRMHLFDPFYSGRQAGRGLGFGLPKCRRIVSNHGGRMEVESRPLERTTFTVYWPSRPMDVES